jgi:amino acid adenylation domain-containing protein
LCLERSLEATIALLGLFKAGAVYVPLEPSLPTERLLTLLQESQVVLLLTRQAISERVSELVLPVLSLERVWQQIEQVPLSQDSPRRSMGAESLAYVIYTSGSTGRPKGVLVPHQAIGTRLDWGVGDVQLRAQDRVVQVASWGFDISLWELFGPWMVGGVVVLAPAGGGAESGRLLGCLREEGVTVAHFVPSLLRVLVQEPEFAACGSLRSVLCGGEAVSRELVRRVCGLLGVTVHQFYGPTEAAISVTSWQARGEALPPSGSIGRPISQARVYLVDRYGELVTVGMRGEVWIGGVGVAWGYQGQAQESAERFIPDPFSGEAGARVYRTGDLGRYLPDGTIVFLGRGDEQVKVRGYRVEPGEIEGVLDGHAGVRASVVVAQGGERLVAYVERSEGETVTGKQLREDVRRKLPEYMVPSFVVFVEALPVLSSGKVNRRQLPAPEEVEGEREEAMVGPRTPMEEMVAEIWREVLKRPAISIHADFFDLGGHSLLATQVISRIRNKVHLDVPLRSLFEAPTIAELALIIEKMQAMLLEQTESEELASMLTVLEELSEEEIQKMLDSDV